jgi:hypothetical protein
VDATDDEKLVGGARVAELDCLDPTTLDRTAEQQASPVCARGHGKQKRGEGRDNGFHDPSALPR